MNSRLCFAVLMVVAGLSCMTVATQTMASGLVAQPVTHKLEKVRSWHFVLRFVSLERARWMVDRAHDAGFNTVVVTVTDGVRLDNAPWKPSQEAWSKDEFNGWVGYARSKGMEVVPEFKLLTHQEIFFQEIHPDLMFNAVTYDPRQEAVYKLVFPLLDEIIALIHPRAIHIGHDEVMGWNKRYAAKILRPNEKMLPDDLFLKDVLRVHDYLKARGVETWMWGDMLISSEEFTGMLDSELHGGSVEYGKALRNQLPRDIVICDWHYDDDQPDYPSLAAMRKEGFRVIGSTWKKPETTRAFSRYAAQHGADGMIATTWAHVQNKEWDVVERIIRESGEAFSKDFPDVQGKKLIKKNGKK